MMEWWATLLISLASAVVSAIVTGFFTLGIERRKQGRIELQKQKEELQKQYEERPRLELKKFKDLEHGKIQSKCDCECLLLNIEKIEDDNGHFLFYYDDKALDLNNLCCVEYIFINTGKTEIDSICVVSTHPRTTSMIELDKRNYLFDYKTINYESWSSKRFIKPGESVSVKICYVKDKVMVSPISAVAAIYMEDINGHLWHQPLFCPTDEMENSNRANYKEFRDNKNVGLALDCFKDPSLW